MQRKPGLPHGDDISDRGLRNRRSFLTEEFTITDIFL